MHRRISAITLVTALAFNALPLAALADPQPEDAKDYRQSVMRALGGHIGAISMHMRGLVDDRGFLAKHASALATTASELSFLFPPGSNVGDSEALPAIWEEPGDFEEAIARAQQATAAFSEATASGNAEAIDAAFRELAGACRGCHDRFRKEHDH